MNNIFKPNFQLIIAHRGESYDAPENSLSAINLTWQRAADGIEIDVHLTKDNEIIVIHNKKIKNTSGKRVQIRTQTLKELKKNNIKSIVNNKLYIEQIPTLNETLLTIPSGKYIFIEIKCGIEIIPFLKDALDKSRLDNDQIKIIGFGLKKMSVIKNEFPQYEVLINKKNIIPKINLYKPSLDNFINKLKLSSLDGLNLSYSSSISLNFVQRFKQNNLKLYIWTLNDYKKISKLFRLGVNGVMTDRAGWVKDRITNS